MKSPQRLCLVENSLKKKVEFSLEKLYDIVWAQSKKENLI